VKLADISGKKKNGISER